MGRVVRYLKARGITEITIDTVQAHAAAAGASRHLARLDKVRWCKGVAALYARERAAPPVPTAVPEARNAAPAEGAAKPDAVTFKLEGFGNHIDMYLEAKRQAAAVRGSVRGRRGTGVPQTTNGDVLKLSAIWSKELARAALEDGFWRAQGRWATCVDEIERIARRAPPSERFAQNDHFWDCCYDVASFLESRSIRPGFWTMVYESVVEAVQELPGRIHDAAKEARSWFREPLILGALVVGAVLLLPTVLARGRG